MGKEVEAMGTRRGKGPAEDEGEEAVPAEKGPSAKGSQTQMVGTKNGASQTRRSMLPPPLPPLLGAFSVAGFVIWTLCLLTVLAGLVAVSVSSPRDWAGLFGKARSAGANGPVALTDATFEEVTQSATGRGGPWFVAFTAPWCVHCQTMAPEWTAFADKHSGHRVGRNDALHVGQVDATASPGLTARFADMVQGFPTLILFRDGIMREYTGPRDVAHLEAFALGGGWSEVEGQRVPPHDPSEAQRMRRDKISAALKASKARGDAAWVPDEAASQREASAVRELSEDDFEETVDGRGENALTFVKFYAPWCGHCKKLAPAWEELAAEAMEEASGRVRLAKVDAEKNAKLAAKYGVSGYPTLLLFNGSSRVEDAFPYTSGQRTLSALRHFALEGGWEDAVLPPAFIETRASAVFKAKEEGKHVVVLVHRLAACGGSQDVRKLLREKFHDELAHLGDRVVWAHVHDEDESLELMPEAHAYTPQFLVLDPLTDKVLTAVKHDEGAFGYFYPHLGALRERLHAFLKDAKSEGVDAGSDTNQQPRPAEKASGGQAEMDKTASGSTRKEGDATPKGEL